jgi:environmental stress-induced protein Ves
VNNLQIYQPTSYQEMPWRNGLGKTLVLLSEPNPGAGSGSGSGSGPFVYRLSIAGVASNGPFSRFDDCDRTLVLLEGKGLTLTHGNGQEVELRARFAEAQFPGDIETVATLHHGPIRDFNVICHRHHCSAIVTVLGHDGSNRLDVNSDLLLAYAVDGPARILPRGGPSVRIGYRELLRCDDPAHGSWTISGGPVIVVAIHYKPTGR